MEFIVTEIFDGKENKRSITTSTHGKDVVVSIDGSGILESVNISDDTVIIKELIVKGYDSISSCAFMGLKEANLQKLTIIKIPTISREAFAGLKVQQIDLSMAHTRYFGTPMFTECRCKKIIWDAEQKTIKARAFYRTPNLEVLEGIENVEAVERAFENSNLKILDLSSCYNLCYIESPFGKSGGEIIIPFDFCGEIKGEYSIDKNKIIFSEIKSSAEIEIAGKTFVLTGKMWTDRASIEAAIHKKGGYVANSITGSVDYLVSTRTDTVKYKKAVSLGITVITDSILRCSL